MKNLLNVFLLLTISFNALAQDENDNVISSQTSNDYFEEIFSMFKSKDLDQKVDDLINTKNGYVDTINKIDKLTSKLIDLSEIKNDEQENGYCRDWFIKVDCQDKINSLMSQLEPIVFDGILINYSDLIEELQTSTAELQKDKVERNSVIKNPVASEDEKKEAIKTVNEIDQQIINNNANIERLQIHLQERLELLGTKLTIDQVNQLTTRVDGNDIAKSIAIMDVTRQITSTLGELMEANSFSPETTTEYYGVYLILSEMLGYTQKQMIFNIDNKYLITLDSFKAEALKNIENSTTAKLSASEGFQALHQNNIDVNQRLLSGIELYKKLLIAHKGLLENANEKTIEQINVAYLTYQTASNSANVIGMIKQTQSNIEALLAMQIPEIIPYDDIQTRLLVEQVQKKFKQVSG